jgi:hypothetical protein
MGSGDAIAVCDAGACARDEVCSCVSLMLPSCDMRRACARDEGYRHAPDIGSATICDARARGMRVNHKESRNLSGQYKLQHQCTLKRRMIVVGHECENEFS